VITDDICNTPMMMLGYYTGLVSNLTM